MTNDTNIHKIILLCLYNMLLCTVFCINMHYQLVWTMYIGKTTHWWVAWLLPCCLFFSVASTKEYAKPNQEDAVIIKIWKIQHSISIKVAVDCFRTTLSRTQTVLLSQIILTINLSRFGVTFTQRISIWETSQRNKPITFRECSIELEGVSCVCSEEAQLQPHNISSQ